MYGTSKKNIELPAPKEQEVEPEFKNQPDKLRRLSKARTGSKHWKLERFKKHMEICNALAITRTKMCTGLQK